MKNKAIQYVRWLMSDSNLLGWPELYELVEISKKYPILYKRAKQSLTNKG